MTVTIRVYHEYLADTDVTIVSHYTECSLVPYTYFSVKFS